MKVIFRIKIKDKSNAYEYMNYARRIRDLWNETKDLDCMVIPEDVEVYVVDDDSEPIIEVVEDGE